MKRIQSISIIAAALLCANASGQTLRGAWVVCTRNLELRETLLDHADERELVLRSEYGIRSRISMNDVLFMVRRESQSDPVDEFVGAPLPELSPVRLISLTDGQIVRGTVLEPELPELFSFTMIAGRNIHGQARIPIERILRVADEQSLTRSYESLAPLRDDTLRTRTGDEIIGFIESIGPMTLVSLSDGSELSIETARVSEIHFANQADILPGLYLTFNDRETFRVSVFEYDNQQPVSIDVDTTSLGLEDTGNSTWIFETDSLQSLRVIDPGVRVLAMSDIEPERIEAMGDREWAPAPVLLDRSISHPTLASIDLRSPMRAHYPVPKGASRFACSIEAPIEEWTDCVVRVIARTDRGDTTLLEQRLNGSRSSADLNARLPSGTTKLIFEVDPGEHGPIQDRVLLHQPRLLIEL